MKNLFSIYLGFTVLCISNNSTCSEREIFFAQANKVRICNSKIRNRDETSQSKSKAQLIADRNNELDKLEKIFHETAKSELLTVFAHLKDSYLLNKATATRILLTSKPEQERDELKDARKFLKKDFRILLGGCCDRMFDDMDSGQCA